MARRRGGNDDAIGGILGRGDRFTADSPYAQVVIGTKEVAGGRGDRRPGRIGPRMRPGSTANPRATALQIPDVNGRTPTYEEAAFGGAPNRGQPAEITVDPTNTTNIQRPRTLRAGYNRTRQTLTVVFRDGTTWNYYGVSYQMWTAFKASPSPGRYIRTRLDFKAYGPAAGNPADADEQMET